jgi:hypothetical protein
MPDIPPRVDYVGRSIRAGEWHVELMARSVRRVPDIPGRSFGGCELRRRA